MAVHPHVRGVNGSETAPPRLVPVHPHVRGVNFVNSDAARVIRRFIPTCVGLIGTRQRCHYAFSVHPHVRGVNVYGTGTKMPVGGSSPRAWG